MPRHAAVQSLLAGLRNGLAWACVMTAAAAPLAGCAGSRVAPDAPSSAPPPSPAPSSAPAAPVLHSWLLRPTEAGRQLGLQPLGAHIDAAVIGPGGAEGAARLVSLVAVDGVYFRAILACSSEAACAAAGARVAALSAWVAEWTRDAPVSRPRTPSGGSMS